jgi:hypothetical protein
MKTVTDLLREQMYSKRGITEEPKRNSSKMLCEIKAMTASLESLVVLAKPRLIMGGIRYGSNWTHEALINYMQGKFDAYKETGNFELLVDLFNFIAIENQLKTHPKFHFNPIDRKE